MGANPITYESIEAFERKMLVRIPPWETELLMRIDDAVLVASQEKAPKHDPKAPPEPIPADNVKGLKALFRGLAVKKKAQGKG